SNLISYFFSGIIYWGGYHDPLVKGFDYIPVNTVNLIWTMPMLFLLTNLVYSLTRRLGTIGFNKFMGDIRGAGKLAKLYGKASSKGISCSILLGCFWGMIMGFFVQSPISLFILPITLFLSFTLREEGKIIGIVSMCLISINISKKEPKYVNIADIALGILGLSVGFALYFLLVLMMWLIFDYVILARLVFTTIFALMFLFIYKAKNKKLVKEVANTTMIIFL
ncbi:MAG TPA: hypothetical protein VFD57_03230, partial [Clostridia bacterium]|nr:hypothetical protein [Clostridia bacterium]